jgi:hypothetical protein
MGVVEGGCPTLTSGGWKPAHTTPIISNNSMGVTVQSLRKEYSNIRAVVRHSGIFFLSAAHINT